MRIKHRDQKPSYSVNPAWQSQKHCVECGGPVDKKFRGYWIHRKCQNKRQRQYRRKYAELEREKKGLKKYVRPSVYCELCGFLIEGAHGRERYHPDCKKRATDEVQFRATKRTQHRYWKKKLGPDYPCMEEYYDNNKKGARKGCPRRWTVGGLICMLTHAHVGCQVAKEDAAWQKEKDEQRRLFNERTGRG